MINLNLTFFSKTFLISRFCKLDITTYYQIIFDIVFLFFILLLNKIKLKNFIIIIMRLIKIMFLGLLWKTTIAINSAKNII